MKTVDKLEIIFSKHLPNTHDFKPTAETLLSELGIDSLGFIELIAEIESEFNLNLTNDDVDKLKTVGDVIKLVS
jgi:acyl carrier protein